MGIIYISGCLISLLVFGFEYYKTPKSECVKFNEALAIMSIACMFSWISFGIWVLGRIIKSFKDIA